MAPNSFTGVGARGNIATARAGDPATNTDQSLSIHKITAGSFGVGRALGCPEGYGLTCDAGFVQLRFVHTPYIEHWIRYGVNRPTRSLYDFRLSQLRKLLRSTGERR